MYNGIDIIKELEDLLVKEWISSINQKIIQDLLNPQNIRKAKIETIKQKIKSSE